MKSPDSADVLPWRGSASLRSFLSAHGDMLPLTEPSVSVPLKYKSILEGLTAPRVGPFDINEHHPKYVWAKFWPTLSGHLSESELPDRFVAALSAATCTDVDTVRKEIERRVLVTELALAEKVLKTEQKNTGIEAAVKEFLTSTCGQSNAPTLRACLKARHVPQLIYQSSNRCTCLLCCAAVF